MQLLLLLVAPTVHIFIDHCKELLNFEEGSNLKQVVERRHAQVEHVLRLSHRLFYTYQVVASVLVFVHHSPHYTLLLII